jgi:hypothetical protein
MGIRLRNLDYLRDDLRDDPDSLSDSCLDPYQLEAARIMEQDLEMGEAAAPRTAADTLRRWLANEPANRVIYDGMERIGRPIDLLEQALAEAAAPASPDVVEALRGLLAWADRVHDEEDTSRLLDHLERHDALDRAREVLAALPDAPAGLDVERLERAMLAAGEKLGADPATPQLYPSDAPLIAAAYAEGKPR